MSHAKKIQALTLEIKRLTKAKQSNHARHIDIANLLDARDKLRRLEQEALITVSKLKPE